MWNVITFREIFLSWFVLKADTSKVSFWNWLGNLGELIKNWHLNSNLWSAFSIWKVKKRAIQRRLNEKSTFKIFRKSLSWSFDLLFKWFPLTAVLLQVATWVCIKNWLYSLLVTTSSSAYLFAIFLKFLRGGGCFIAEALTTLNLA